MQCCGSRSARIRKSLPPWIRIHMDIFLSRIRIRIITDADPQHNRCGSAALLQYRRRFFITILDRTCLLQRILEEVALIPSKPLRNKVRNYVQVFESWHGMLRIFFFLKVDGAVVFGRSWTGILLSSSYFLLKPKMIFIFYFLNYLNSDP